jgi:glycosyltransferase involved in cell wall biosynthesis
MLLSVLMPALAKRSWQVLLSELRDQSAEYPGRVEILHEVDNGSATSGIKRQRLLTRAKGEYVCYVDDDDVVAPYYITALLNACITGVDVITFNMMFHHWLDRKEVSTEVWRLGLYEDDRQQGRMSANHLCAWRRDIARRVSWSPRLGYGDDQLWYGPLMASGLINTTIHIDEVLYDYMYDIQTSVNQRLDRVDYSRKYFGNGIRCFKDNRDNLYIEEIDEVSFKRPQIRNIRRFMRVRDCNGNVRPLDSSMRLYHTVKLVGG